MIEENRPLCIMEYIEPRDILKRINDPFKDFGLWTLDEEPYSETQQEWESCCATWNKRVDQHTRYVKCMEPAIYAVSIHDGCGEGRMVYCGYHRPRIQKI